MAEWQEEASNRISQYAEQRGIAITERLGQGYVRVVVSTDAQTALKSFAFEKLYLNERNI